MRLVRVEGSSFFERERRANPSRFSWLADEPRPAGGRHGRCAGKAQEPL